MIVPLFQIDISCLGSLELDGPHPCVAQDAEHQNVFASCSDYDLVDLILGGNLWQPIFYSEAGQGPPQARLF